MSKPVQFIPEFIQLTSAQGLNRISIRKSAIAVVEPKDTSSEPGANIYLGPSDGYCFEVQESAKEVMRLLGEVF